MLAPSVEPRSARGCGEEGSHFQVAFGRLRPCLGDQSVVRARALRKLGYEVTITPINQLAVGVAVHV